MKRYIHFIAGICVYLFFGVSLFSQQISSGSDTTWTYDFSSVDDSVLTAKTILTWQDSANTTLQGIHRAIPPEGEWNVASRFYREYNDQGKQTYALQINWSDADKAWYDNHKWETFYDAHGNDTLHYSSYKLSAGSEWTSALGYRNEIRYNDKDQLMLKEVFEGYPGQEQLKRMHEYGHDLAGNQTIELTHNWSGTEWQSLNLIETSFDAQGRQTSQLNSSWQSTERVMEYVSKYIYGYDAEGNQNMVELSAWDPTNRTPWCFPN